MASSNEEMELLERVFLRFGSAETDEQLEQVINKFLIPVLLKLSSNNEGVRKKVMELLIHVNKRIKRRPNVQLPVEALLKLYGEPSATTFFINFAILYIKMGYPRLPATKQTELGPLLLAVLKDKPQSHQNSLLQLFVTIVGNLKVPTEPEKKKNFLQLNEQPHLVTLLSDFMLDVLLMPYVWIPESNQNTDESSAGQATPAAPPGMSPYGLSRISSSDSPLTGETLETVKRGILSFLISGVLPLEEVFCHLVVGASDTRFTVTDIAETELNRVSGSVNWSNITMADKLFTIYLGTVIKKNIPENQWRQPANTRIRMKILNYLARLEKQAILFPQCLHVIWHTFNEVTSNAKLKLSALNFALAIIRKADLDLLNKISTIVYAVVLKVVKDPETPDHLKVVGYTILGQVVKRLPKLVKLVITMELQGFFDGLKSNSPDIRTAVRDSFLCMVDAFKMALNDPEFFNDQSSNDAGKMSDPETRAQIINTLLAAQINESEPIARYVAATFLGSIFPTNHIPSRYLLLLSSGDSASNVSQLALKSLSEGIKSDDNDEVEIADVKLLLPDFPLMVKYLSEKMEQRLKNPQHKVVVGKLVLPFPIATANNVLHYLRLYLANSAGLKIRQNLQLGHPCDSSPIIKRYLEEVFNQDNQVLKDYLKLIEDLLPAVPSAALSSLLEVVGCCPHIFAQSYSDKLPKFMNLMSDSQVLVRESAAQLFAIISTSVSMDNCLTGDLMGLLTEIKSKNIETQHSQLLAIGFIVERMLFECPEKVSSWNGLSQIIQYLDSYLNEEQPLLLLSACSTISMIFKNTSLPLPDTCENLSKEKLLLKLISLVTNGKTTAVVKDKAIFACGCLCLGEDFPHTQLLLDKFLEISKETKEIEIHFAIGEAIILAIEGLASVLKRNVWNVLPNEYKKPSISEKNKAILDGFLNELIKTSALPHPNTRQATCVYLLSIIKRLDWLENVQKVQLKIQGAFMDLLSENNEFVQDMASKGLALIYENSNAEEQKVLVSEILDQLLSGRKTTQQVTADTKLFEEGQLGTSPTGGNLSTYKELCSLASDLNQPDLIYKFMHLANHNAVWNSKKGAAFGFKTIASKANQQLNEYLPVVVPRLYRYQFDPTPRIQQSMANIWHTLVKDTSKCVNTYQKQIFDDLLVNLTSTQWRVRTSCCLALVDFFRGNQSVLDFKDKLEPLWASLFRVMDDVHEGTRVAAQNTSKTLANICVRVCDTDRGKPDEEMIQIMLKIFLKGIVNTVTEVRELSLQSVSQFVNSSGVYIKPCLPVLIAALLEAAGELESVKLSHLSAQFGGQSQAQNVIDSVRADFAKSHYTTQTVAKCVQYMDLEVLNEITPKIVEIMKSVNLGSKVACAHLIILLAHHFGKSMEALTGKFLAALVNGLLDRNATVRKIFAPTIGQILHTAKPSSVERLTKKLASWYFEKEDVNVRSAIGATLQASAHYNAETLKNEYRTVVPLVFFAMHDIKNEETKSVIEIWEEVWNEITPGTEGGIKQNLAEIITLLKVALESPSWNMKAQAGRCITTLANRLDVNLPDEERKTILHALLVSLQGRTFRGKEELLTALSTLTTRSSKDFRKNFPTECETIIDALIKECNKADLEYKKQSIKSLGEVLEKLDDIDRFKEVYEIAQEILQKLKNNSDEGEGIDELKKSRNAKFETLSILYETLGKSWPKNKTTQLTYEDTLLNECLQTLEQSPREVQVSILTALGSFVEKLHYFDMELDENGRNRFREILSRISQAIVFALGVSKHTRLRKEALNVLWLLKKRLKETSDNEEYLRLKNSLADCRETLEKDPTPEIRARLLDLKDLFS